ncbi:MAG: SDR family oxidoreductase [Candidatus Latescibacteria bacterium]|nr:SDR family oxidoreductase [Candidatus Latescibacterota bacterium]
MEQLLAGRVALVTGAAGGMGLAIAQALGQRGAAVALTDIDAAGVDSAAQGLAGEGLRVMAAAADVTDQEQVTGLVAAVEGALGTVDILVNCAGLLYSSRIDQISKAEWDQVLNVNLNGTFLCSQAVLAGMRAKGWGRIVNIASSAGRSVSTLGGAHYTAAKAGVLGFTRALAKEVAPWGISVNAVCPGLVDTPMARNNCTPQHLDEYAQSFPARRLGTAQEVARLVVFLAAEGSYIDGAAIDINGGDLML